MQKNESIESEAFERGLAKGKAESANDKKQETDDKPNTAEEVNFLRVIIRFDRITIAMISSKNSLKCVSFHFPIH